MAERTALRTDTPRRNAPARTALPRTWPLLADQIRYQMGLLLRTPRAISTGLALPVLLLLLSDGSRGHLPAAHVAGLATLGVTMSAWTTHGISLVAAREAGVLKRWRATPLPRWCYFAGRMVATVVVATMAGAITIGVAAVLFRTPVGPGAVAELLGVFALGALACAAACTAVTSFVPNVASAFPVLGLTYLPVVLISGALGSPAAVPDWLVRVTDFLPIRPITEAAADSLPGHGVPLTSIVVLACWVAAGLVAALATFRWEPTRPRQKRPART